MFEKRGELWLPERRLRPIEGGGLSAANLSMGSANPIVSGSAAPGTSGFASHQDHVHPSGGSSITFADNVLAADVTVSGTINTFTTILTLASLAAGTWYFWCDVQVSLSGNSNILTFRLHNGTSAVGAAEVNKSMFATNAGGMTVNFLAKDTPAGVTTYTLAFCANAATDGSIAKAAGTANSQGNVYTRILAIKVA